MGAGVGRPPPPSENRPPADLKGPPLFYFNISMFNGPNVFLKAKIGKRPPKQLDFLVEIFQKAPKTHFLGRFSKFCLRRRHIGKKGSLQCLVRSQKINLVDYKQKITTYLFCVAMILEHLLELRRLRYPTLFPFSPTCIFLHVTLLTRLSDCNENSHTD